MSVTKTTRFGDKQIRLYTEDEKFEAYTRGRVNGGTWAVKAAWFADPLVRHIDERLAPDTYAFWDLLLDDRTAA